MATNRLLSATRRWIVALMTMVLCGCLTGCGGCGKNLLIGMVYKNVKLPLTENLNATPMPDMPPSSDRVVEIKEPITGAGIYARVSVNAIGEIALQNGVETLYFADQEIFSILGVWKTNRVYLYGDPPHRPPPSGVDVTAQ